jgi:hypothetical protein
MGLDWKKIGIIAIIAGATVLFVFMIYYFFFKPFISPELELEIDTNQEVSDDTGLPTIGIINGRRVILNPDGTLPLGSSLTDTPDQPIIATETASGGLTKTTAVVIDPTRYINGNQSGGLQYYNTIDGKFYRILPNGDIELMSDKVFNNVSSVVWSNDSNKAILEYPDGANILYDFETNKQVTLPRHWEEFDFSPSDQNLIFKNIALDVENRYLVVSNTDGSQARIIEPIGRAENKFNSDWSPNNQIVATFSEAKDLNRSEVYFIGLNGENFKSMIVEGRGFEGLWSPDGEKMFYSVYDPKNDYKPELWVSNASPGSVGDNRQKIGLQTWANKCTFNSGTSVFCAVPTSLSFGAGMGQKESTEGVPDVIYEINLNTGAKRLIAIPQIDLTIGTLVVSDETNQLFFTDQDTNMIYKINL